MIGFLKVFKGFHFLLKMIGFPKVFKGFLGLFMDFYFKF